MSNPADTPKTTAAPQGADPFAMMFVNLLMGGGKVQATEREQALASACQELIGALRDRRAARHELGRLVTTPNAQDQSAYGLAVECAQKADTRVKVAVANLEALL